MWHLTRIISLRFAIICLVIVAVPDFILGLRNVSVTVPTAVKKGDNAHLICNYDMEGETLYSVKWYKGKREFFRYTPKENPGMKIFPLPGITVQRSLSNQSHLVLLSVEPSISGKFSCEVSADAPFFHTMIVTGDMEIVEIPEQRPTLTGIHSRYRLGDIVNGNCSSHYSKPAANLTWTINDVPAALGQTKIYQPVKNPADDLESSVVEINFIITHQHFIRGRLKLKCTARIYSIYEQDVEKLIEEDRPRILASGRSPDVNLFPYDQQADGELSDQNELYLTHYKADVASSASSFHMRNVCNWNEIRMCRGTLSTVLFCSIIVVMIIVLNSFDNIRYYYRINRNSNKQQFADTSNLYNSRNIINKNSMANINNTKSLTNQRINTIGNITTITSIHATTTTTDQAVLQKFMIES